MPTYDFDLLVIGGGPAGVTAALRASELGARTALVERARMGGTCTNDGCVPTRVLAKAARLLRDARQFEDYGLAAAPPELDFDALMTRVQQVVYTIHEKKQLIRHLEDSRVAVFTGAGAARFVDPHRIRTENGETFTAEKFILSAGGRPRRLPFPGAEHALTHSDIWSLRTLPRSAAIIGAAATGCQLASIFSAFGCDVALLDIAPAVLPAEDPAISEGMRAAFTARGIRIETGISGVDRIERSPHGPHGPHDPHGLALHYRRGDAAQTLDSEIVVFAVGWPGNVDSLDLPAAGVKTNGSYVEVDEHLRTSVPHIFAAGDITGRMMLVQSAGYEARLAAENALSETLQSAQHQIVPHGGFTDPEYASVGLTEPQARDLTGEDCTCAAIRYSQMDRAVIDGRPEGFCKLVADRRDHTLLGAHVMGEQALEIVHLVASGMAAGITVDRLADLEIAYPTYTAAVGLAARKLASDLAGAVPVQEWRDLDRIGLAEWEIES
ncbi:MAG TPA: NAD(P)/FAD-dependent oxidoreductase [Anaerolineales bacterium]|nr:NAD(P)/FAD-dependent oxidoreductase [Anaerolineales bacterium]